MKINSIFLSSITAGLMLIASVASGTTEHDNVVEFDSEDNLEEYSIVYYWDGDYSITSGQPWDGITTNNVTTEYNAGYQVDAMAGRHSSGPPADFFNARANGLFATTNSNKSTPSGMNFAFSGILEINGLDYKIVIGQNGCGTSNCWYVGPNESGFRAWNDSSILTPDQRFYIYASGENTFAIGIYCSGNCPDPNE